MRLFRALFRKKMPNGHIWRGKDRLSHNITFRDTQNMKNQFELEERNMFYLRHSYLTPEQSFGHAKALGKTAESKFVQLLSKKKDFKENITIDSQLGHLRHGEAWD